MAENKVDEVQKKIAPVIILVKPQLGQNIGMAARAMANFSLDELRIVNPRDGWPNEDAIAASSNAAYVIESAKIYPTLEEAIADLHMILATTARPRDLIKEVITPEKAGQVIVAESADKRKSGILFGREKAGLSNEHLSFAEKLVIAPVNPDCASLNLAQAVLLMAYEWQKASGGESLGRKTTFDGPAYPGMPEHNKDLATKKELTALFGHLEEKLTSTGFLYPPHKVPKMMINIKNMFLRMNMTHQDVQTFRGMIKSLAQGRNKGRNKANNKPHS